MKGCAASYAIMILVAVCITAIFAGPALAASRVGTVWAWGSNGQGQTGDGGTIMDRLTPVQVKGPDGTGFLTKAAGVAAGFINTMAIIPPSSHDFNNDGKPDILWRNVASGWNVVWHMDGVTPLSDHELPSVSDTTWWIAGKQV